MSGAAPGGLRVGIDLVAVDEVAESVARFGDRYVHRIFTDHEISCCIYADDETGTSYVMESLAARFAAKEAVLKVLRPVEVQPPWRSIELHRMAGGWSEIHLSGQASELASRAGIGELSVSLSHEANLAAAVVVGWCRPRTRGER